ncbi:MAG TPA: Ni/Fe hydrogenase subunit alpha [Hadesarchaea archaeon]|nr:Ni/Fe hydrogenase subunit alpha [Hadesarchaea archaeon]
MSGSDVNINIHHVTRVEGHGNIVVDVKNGELKEIKLEIVESPRFFEAMVVGRRFSEAVHITSRICGICAVSHTNASIKSVEDALGIKPTWQTETLRRILAAAEVIDSHALHAFFLAAPDFVRLPSVIPLIGKSPEIVKIAVNMKKLSHDICDVIAGRHTHPISMAVDGFTNLVSEEQMHDLQAKIKQTLENDVPKAVEFFSKLKIPWFERRTDYVCLTHPGEYAFYDGTIKSSETGEYRHRDYKLKIAERVVDHSTAKHTYGPVKPYMVGALSRFNNNYDQLTPQAKEAAGELKLTPQNHNPYYITLAQLVEIVHCLEWSAGLIEELLSRGIKDEREERPPISGWSVNLPDVKKSWGVGVTEAPRGLLIHEYRIDDNGLIDSANCITPTAQNLANIESDMRKLVPEIIREPKDEIELLLEMLVRAYDPCISCSAHILKVNFVE